MPDLTKLENIHFKNIFRIIFENTFEQELNSSSYKVIIQEENPDISSTLKTTSGKLLKLPKTVRFINLNQNTRIT